MLTLQSVLDEKALEEAQRAADAAWSTAYWTAWLTIATFLLFVGAAVAAVYAVKTWRATKGQLDAAEGQLSLARDQDRKREASAVSAWLTRSHGVVIVNVTNMNAGAVYDLSALVESREQLPDGIAAPKIIWDKTAVAVSPTREPEAEQTERFGVLPEKDHVGQNVHADKGVLADSWRLWDGQGGGLSLLVSFRDSSGIYWRRDERGILTEVDEQLLPVD